MSTTQIAGTTSPIRYSRCPGLVYAEVQGQLVALSFEKGFCYGANSVGSRIWRMLGERQGVDAICSALEAEFDVDHEMCEREVLAFLRELQAEGLIEAAT